jgi:hypothetical protein
MTERWMKEKASKSFGGSCMSKFVLENERKRILRLKNMKSSIVKLSCNKHENHWMKNKIEKRCREIKQSRRNLCGSSNHGGGGGGGCKDDNDGKEVVEDFDLVFHPNVDVTKSGLKLRLTNNASSCANNKTTVSNLRVKNVNREEENKRSKSTIGLVNDGHVNKIMHNTSSNSTMQNDRKVIINEGKENQSPSHVVPKKEVIISNVSKARMGQSGLNIRKKKNEPSSVSSIKDELKNAAASKSVEKNGKLNRNKNKLHETKPLPKTLLKRSAINSSLEGSRHSSVILKLKANIAAPRRNEKKKKFQQLHTNRGASLTSLSKEKEEALAMLKALDITKPSSSLPPPCASSVRETKDNKENDDVMDHNNSIEQSKETTEFTTIAYVSNVDHLNDDDYQYSKPSIEGIHSKCIDNIEKDDSNVDPIDQQSATEEFYSSHEDSQSNGDDSAVSRIDLMDKKEDSLNNEGKDMSSRNDSHLSYSSFDGRKIQEDDNLKSIADDSYDEKSWSNKSFIKTEDVLIGNDSDCKISDQISVESSHNSITYSDSFDSDKSDEVSLDTKLLDKDNNETSSNLDIKCATRKSKNDQNDIDWTPQFKAESFFELNNL